MLLKGGNFIICGIGGQGIVLTSDIVSKVFLASEYDIKATDIIGLGQRGGSVVTHIRTGEKIYSPLIKRGEADIILAFEKYEGLRWLPYLKRKGKLIVNDCKNRPTSVINGLQEDIDIDERMRGLDCWKLMVPGAKILKDHHMDGKFVNIFMTGVFSKYTDIDDQYWEQIIRHHVPPPYLEENIKAFRMGRGLIP